MNDVIIKFKNDLKKYQQKNKKAIKQYDEELSIIERMLNFDPTLKDEINLTEETFLQLTPTFQIIFVVYLEEKKNKHKWKLWEKHQKNNDGKDMGDIKQAKERFKDFIAYCKSQYSITQNIINAFENDKIKEPINDLNILISNLKFTNLTPEETSQIIGMAIVFNYQYAKRNKNHKINNIEVINKLSEYYNPDGTFIYNDDISTFKDLINQLLQDSITEIINPRELIDRTNFFTITDIINLLIENNEATKNTDHKITTENIVQKKELHTTVSKTNEALQELKKYYKNGTIVKVPENLDEFYKILEESNLDNIEIQYIKELITKKITNNTESTLRFLTEKEKYIYETSLELLKKLDYSSNDIYELKKSIQDLQTIIELLKSNNDKEDKEFLLAEVPSIIEKLSIICNKYAKEEDKENTNRFIFLLDKDNIPFIEKDINSLDQVYKKIIYSLIPKININNQHLFKKVLNSEKLPYNMCSIYSTKAYITFVEMQPGIYLLIGANVARTGYKEQINRLISNQNEIKIIEDIIKDTNNKNNLLVAHEEYLPLLSETNSENLTRKKNKNTHN